MNTIRFGRLQLRIMKILWRRTRANAREITDALNEQAPVAHSTVQTLLRKLERKGAIAHEIEDRTFVFIPLVEEQKATRSVTREFLDGVFGGSVAGLMAHLLKNEKIPRKEWERIRKLIDEQEER